MDRNSKLFLFCTLIEPHIRIRREVSICTLIGGFCQTVLLGVIFAALACLMLWVFGVVIGEVTAMIVTRTFLDSWSKYFILSISIGFLLTIFLAIVTIGLGMTIKWLNNFSFTYRCKKIQITD